MIKIVFMRKRGQRKKIFIILSVLLLLSLNFFLKPYLHERDVLKIVTAVLNSWQRGDLTSGYAFWKDPEKSPPIYGLVSYKLKDKYFGKREKKSSAQISAVLEFTPDNVFPSGEEWIFELEKDDGDWKILDFRLKK